MPPHGKCRVCGAPAPGNMPCYRCAGLLLERDNNELPTLVRLGAAIEITRILKGVRK